MWSYRAAEAGIAVLKQEIGKGVHPGRVLLALLRQYDRKHLGQYASLPVLKQVPALAFWIDPWEKEHQDTVPEVQEVGALFPVEITRPPGAVNPCGEITLQERFGLKGQEAPDERLSRTPEIDATRWPAINQALMLTAEFRGVERALTRYLASEERRELLQVLRWSSMPLGAALLVWLLKEHPLEPLRDCCLEILREPAVSQMVTPYLSPMESGLIACAEIDRQKRVTIKPPEIPEACYRGFDPLPGWNNGPHVRIDVRTIRTPGYHVTVSGALILLEDRRKRGQPVMETVAVQAWSFTRAGAKDMILALQAGLRAQDEADAALRPRPDMMTALGKKGHADGENS